MSYSVEIGENPSNPAIRYFTVKGRPATIQKPIRITSTEDANEKNVPMVLAFFGLEKMDIKISEIRLFAVPEGDRIGVVLADGANWDRKLGGAATPVNGQQHVSDRTIADWIRDHTKKHIQAGNAIVLNGNDTASLAEMDRHLQIHKPASVDGDGGSVKASSFDAGVLTVEFGKRCASDCPGQKRATRVTITSIMRNKFAEIKEVAFKEVLTIA